MKISWRQWKLGAVVSLAMSAFVTLAGLSAGMTWRQCAAVFGAAAVTHFGAFLTQHPPEQVSFDTETFAARTAGGADNKKENENKTES